MGRAGTDLAQAWAAQLRPGQQRWVRGEDVMTAELLTAFDHELAQAHVGWRLMLAGPEAALALLRARAVAAGAEPAEIQAVLTDIESRTVYCVHCTSSMQASAAIGASLPCADCGRLLHIRPHFSPRLGAYLGAAEPAVSG